MSGSSSQSFGLRLSLDGKEVVLRGVAEIQGAAQQAATAIGQAGESASRGLALIERGSQAASLGLQKMGGDFATLAPVIDTAGGAVGRLVTALGSGAGLVGVLGAVGGVVTAAVLLYQNWESATRAVGTAVDVLTGRVRVNEAAITDANAALRAYLQLSETAAQSANRRYIDQQREAGDSARGRIATLQGEVDDLSAELGRRTRGVRTGTAVDATIAALEANQNRGPSENAVLENLRRQQAALQEESARLQRQAETDPRNVELRDQIARRQRQITGQQYIVDQSEARIAGAVSDQANINPGRLPAEPSAARSGGAASRVATSTREESQALRERDQLIQRNMTADERYTQGLERIAALNDRLIAQGNDPLPDETVQRETTRLMEEYERATQRAANSTQNLADGSKELADLTRGASKALTSALEDFVVEGKSANDVLKDLERNLLRIGWQALVFKPLEEGLNSLVSGGKSGSGGAIGNLLGSLFSSGGGNEIVSSGAGLLKSATATALFHEGGIIGTHGRAGPVVPLAVFANAPRFHTGGIIGPDERPIIAQVGERVLTRQQAAEYASGRQSITVNINGVTNPNEFKQSQSQITGALARALGRSGRNR